MGCELGRTKWISWGSEALGPVWRYEDAAVPLVAMPGLPSWSSHLRLGCLFGASNIHSVVVPGCPFGVLCVGTWEGGLGDEVSVVQALPAFYGQWWCRE
jgi:hypothetical protein